MGPMPLYELHPFTDSEVAIVPQGRGVYVLYQVENPLHADAAENLRRQLEKEKVRLPQATHFAIETGFSSERETAKRVEQLRNELNRVRVKGFVGSSR